MSLNEQICVWILNHKMLTGSLVMAFLFLCITLLVDAIEDYTKTKKEAELMKMQTPTITQMDPTMVTTTITEKSNPETLKTITESLPMESPVNMNPVVMNQIRSQAMAKLEQNLGTPTLKLKRTPA